ncbi:rhodanese [marine bacterium AO1-C]|nr:rhodanese [marine bacterium AO1-C]
MKIFYSINLFFLFLMNLPSHGQTPKQQQAFDQMLENLLTHSVKEVQAGEVMRQSNIIFLDAREKPEFEVSHIPNARWIGYDNFDKKSVANLPKNQKIIVYCSVGYRSEKITEKLLKMGFKDIANLYGGVFAWKHAGGKVVNSKGQTTEKVHTFNKDWSQWLFKGIKVY